MNKPLVAYFSAEYAIADDLPIYAGGLGILAADIVLEASSQNLPFYAVGMVYHEAFAGDDPDQRPITERLTANGYEQAVDEKGERITVHVPIADRTVALQAWVRTWGQTTLILLDARLDENDEADRVISDHLYAKDILVEFSQEMCLGFGGVAMLEAMGLHPNVYHMNEGHTAMTGLAVLLRHLRAHPELTFAQALEAVRPSLVGTKHTILPGAGIFLDWASVTHHLSSVLTQHRATIEDIKPLANRHEYNDYSGTRLMLSLVRAASGVSRIHVALEKRVHPHSPLVPITNGIFRWRWTTSAWDGHPLDYDDAKFWAIHCENRKRLLEHVRQQTGGELNPDALTVVWARRMTAYKRPDLLVSDLSRVLAMAHDVKQPVQFIVAGHANPSDIEGVELQNHIIEAARRPDLTTHFSYLPHYNPISAKFLVRGADLWLNTPIRGFEACGTSGMKASLNGALQFSAKDGWIDEVDISPLGWALPETSPGALYDTLQHEIAPLFYQRTYGIPHEWIVRMRANMKLIQDDFTATRMMADYFRILYEPALDEHA